MQRLTAGRVIELDRDVPEGRQFERLHVYDLELDPGVVPANQDGEVDAIGVLEVAEAAELALSGQMTVDAALVTLDFLLRRDAWLGRSAWRLRLGSSRCCGRPRAARARRSRDRF
jgi:hypothetical protein